MQFRKALPLIITLILLVSVNSLIFSGCSSSKDPSPAAQSSTSTSTSLSQPEEVEYEAEYEFGAMFPMTGPGAFLGEMFVGALNQAVDEINAAGGVDGTMLKVKIEDHQGEAKGGSDAMNRIILNKKIAYTLGSFVDPNLSAQPIAARNQVLIMNAGGCANSLLEKDYLWNNNVMASYLEPPLAEYVYEQGFSRVASIIQNNPEGMDNLSSFCNVWTDLGGEVVCNEVFDTTEMDFKTQLTKIKAANPDVIFMNAVALQASTILKQVQELGINAKVCGPWIDDPGTLIPAGSYANGAITVSAYLDSNSTLPFSSNFINSYNENYAPEGATAYWPAANAYENVYILAELVKRVRASGGDTHSGEALLNALKSDPTFDSVFGTSGELTFNVANHDSQKDVAISIIEDGAPVVKAVIAGADLKSIP